eukprot:gene23906-9474_t
MEGDPKDKPSLVTFRCWKIGIFVYAFGNLFNFGSFAFAAQSLLSALGSAQFVANITKLVLLATACIVGGCVLLVIFGSHESTTYNVEEQIELYKEPLYILYLVMMVVFAFGTYIMYIHGKKVARQCILEGCRAPKWEPGSRMRSFWIQVMPIVYSIYSGLIGTQSVVFSKSLSMLLRLSINGDNQMASWFPYVMLFCFVLTAFFFMSRLNQGLGMFPAMLIGLGMFPAMLIVPMMQICWTLFSIISGIIYWQEYQAFTVLMAAMFSLGVLIVFIGVYLLTLNAKRQFEKEDIALQELEQQAKLEAAAADGEVGSIAGLRSFTGSDKFQPNASFRPRSSFGGGHSLLTSPTAAALYPINHQHGNPLHQHSNPIYDPHPDQDDPNKPRKNDVFDTLIFTSLAATTGGTREGPLAQSIIIIIITSLADCNYGRNQGGPPAQAIIFIITSMAAITGRTRAHLNASLKALGRNTSSGGGAFAPHSPTLSPGEHQPLDGQPAFTRQQTGSTESRQSDTSLMNTFKHSLRSIQKRIGNDFSIINTGAVKSSVGLNESSHVGFYPGPDYTTATSRLSQSIRKGQDNSRRSSASGMHEPHGHDHIASSLPQSRFSHFGEEPDIRSKLSTIRETPSSRVLSTVHNPSYDLEACESASGDGSHSSGRRPTSHRSPIHRQGQADSLETQGSTHTKLPDSLNTTKRQRMKNDDVAKGGQTARLELSYNDDAQTVKDRDRNQLALSSASEAALRGTANPQDKEGPSTSHSISPEEARHFASQTRLRSEWQQGNNSSPEEAGHATSLSSSSTSSNSPHLRRVTWGQPPSRRDERLSRFSPTRAIESAIETASVQPSSGGREWERHSTIRADVADPSSINIGYGAANEGEVYGPIVIDIQRTPSVARSMEYSQGSFQQSLGGKRESGLSRPGSAVGLQGWPQPTSSFTGTYSQPQAVYIHHHGSAGIPLVAPPPQIARPSSHAARWEQPPLQAGGSVRYASPQRGGLGHQPPLQAWEYSGAGFVGSNTGGSPPRQGRNVYNAVQSPPLSSGRPASSGPRVGESLGASGRHSSSPRMYSDLLDQGPAGRGGGVLLVRTSGGSGSAGGGFGHGTWGHLVGSSVGGGVPGVGLGAWANTSGGSGGAAHIHHQSTASPSAHMQLVSQPIPGGPVRYASPQRGGLGQQPLHTHMSGGAQSIRGLSLSRAWSSNNRPAGNTSTLGVARETSHSPSPHPYPRYQ